MTRFLVVPTLLLFAVMSSSVAADDPALRRDAEAALRKAADFFLEQVSTEGGYLWQYSEDLSQREGEGRATDTVVWVQPPGTPTVGQALLRAYRNTGDAYYLEAARQAGYCLVRGQLRSGGWDYRIEFDPKRRAKYAYRVDAAVEGASQRNTTTLDDNTTQAALRLLMDLDETLQFKDARIHEAVDYALAALLAAQYPNGAWPQRYSEPPEPELHPIRRADYPSSWPRTFPSEKYSSFYTFNDNALADVIDVMFLAGRIYDDARYRAAARRGGDFILLAQMPDPQPAWAQQYDVDMHPAWARKFEPPSVTGGESQGVMKMLLGVYRETSEKKYLEPIPRALAYFRRSLLPDGRLARFYELKTNRPLYFTIDYQLTYSDADMPTHYAFKVGQNLDRIENEYRQLLAATPEELAPKPPRAPGKPSAGLMQQARQVIDAMDSRGAWVEKGALKHGDATRPTERIITCRTFVSRIDTLSKYLATKPD